MTEKGAPLSPARSLSDLSHTELVELVLRLREGLSFYARRANWQSPSTGFALQYDPEPSPVDRDRGTRARALLWVVPDA